MKFIEKYSFLFILGVTLGGSYFYFYNVNQHYTSITSYSDCVASGYSVLTTNPKTCKLPGKTFVNDTELLTDQVLGTSTPSKTLETSYKNLNYYLDGQVLHMTEGEALFGATTSKHILFSIKDNPLSLFTQNNGTNYGFFVVKREDSSSRKENYYLGGAMDLNYSFTGLNFVFLDTFVSSTTFELSNEKILTVNYNNEKGLQKKKTFMIREDNFIQESK